MFDIWYMKWKGLITIYSLSSNDLLIPKQNEKTQTELGNFNEEIFSHAHKRERSFGLWELKANQCSKCRLEIKIGLIWSTTGFIWKTQTHDNVS